MPHPIYGPPSHELDRVEVTLWLPSSRNGRRSAMRAAGWSETHNRPLWTVAESWEWAEVTNGLQPADAAHHVMLVASQDRCSSQSHVEASLVGEGWEQVPLF